MFTLKTWSVMMLTLRTVSPDRGSLTELWVSQGGEDMRGCGTKESACKTIQYASSLASRLTDSEAVLVINTEISAYSICFDERVSVDNSIRFRTVGDHGLQACSSGGHPPSLIFDQSVYSKTSSLQLDQARFTNLKLVAKDVNFSTIGGSFLNTSVVIINTRQPPVTVTIRENSFTGDVICKDENCIPQGILNITGLYENVVILDSRFFQTPVLIARVTTANITISRTLVSNDINKITSAKGVVMMLRPLRGVCTITIHNCSFMHQFYMDEVDSAINIMQAALFIRPVDSRPKKTFISIERSHFHGNERAIMIAGFVNHAEINDCTFRNNSALQAGAAIYLVPKDGKIANFTIRRCEFVGNSVGRRTARGSLAKKTKRFSLEGDQVRLYASCCKGSMSLAGKGGAIRAQTGNLSIIDCFFDDNRALKLGGAVFVDHGAKVNITNTTFYNTPDVTKVTHGDILHSNGTIFVNRVKLYIRSALDHTALFHHNGNHWSIRVYDIVVTCPPGFRLRSSNVTSYAIEPNVGFVSSVHLNQLSYFCVSCPRNKYDLTKGYVHYTSVTSELRYLSFIINGSAPNLAAGGRMVLKQPKCHPCPFGGVCDRGIRPQPQFWGYIDGNYIYFISCPAGYCCSEGMCTGYQSCAAHRQGSLCGECVHGYSEALFSPRCVPSNTCNWLWLLIPALVPILYAVAAYHVAAYTGEHDREEKMPSNKYNWIEHRQNGRATTSERTDSESQSGGKAAPSVSEKTSIYPVILTSLFYLQDVKFFEIPSPNAEENITTRAYRILTAFATLRFEDIPFLGGVCVYRDTVAWQRELPNVAIVLWFVFSFLCIAAFLSCCRIRRHSGKFNSTIMMEGFILVYFFIIQTALLSSFRLTHCVALGKHPVLYISGGVTCYTRWQYGVLAYLAISLAPLPICFFFGPTIKFPVTRSPTALVLSLMLPGPTFIYSTGMYINRRLTSVDRRKNNGKTRKIVFAIIHGSFRECVFPRIGPVAWIGLHLGYRIILVIISVYLTNQLMKVLCSTITCFIILLFHSHMRPYNRDMHNNLATGSYSLHMAIGVINCVKATFESANRKPQGPNVSLLQALAHLEYALCVWLPIFVMLSLIFYGTYRLCCKCGRQQSNFELVHEVADVQMHMMDERRASSAEDTD